jgi:hypothetical protein
MLGGEPGYVETKKPVPRLRAAAESASGATGYARFEPSDGRFRFEREAQPRS